MPRSEIRENQVKDADFLSPWEHDHEAKHYFINNEDTPTTYSGYAGNYVVVNPDENGLRFTSSVTTVSGTGWKKISSSYSAVAGDNLFLDSTQSGIVITLPSSPYMGDTIKFIDGPGNCETNPVTVSGAGEKILGSNENLAIDSDNANLALVYYDSTYGWKLGV